MYKEYAPLKYIYYVPYTNIGVFIIKAEYQAIIKFTLLDIVITQQNSDITACQALKVFICHHLF